MLGTFRNTSLCEDIRDEIGNKKSLMGVFSGDILVSEFPARLRVAFYIEYIPHSGTSEHELSLLLAVGSQETITIQVLINTPADQVATLVVPQALALIEAPCELTLSAVCNEEKEVILRKEVRLKANPF